MRLTRQIQAIDPLRERDEIRVGVVPGKTPAELQQTAQALMDKPRIHKAGTVEAESAILVKWPELEP